MLPLRTEEILMSFDPHKTGAEVAILQFSDYNLSQPNTALIGMVAVCQDREGIEIHRGKVEAINPPFQCQIDGVWWETGDASDWSVDNEEVLLFAAWKSEEKTEEDDDPPGVEDKIYEEQYDLIKRQCGKAAAEKANYGWGVTGDKDQVDVSTKVYGHGVLRSIGQYEEPYSIQHFWS
jgi:hypothetical protein